MGILDKIGINVGSAIGNFQKAKSTALGKPLRPDHLTALAKGERWRGGNSPEKLSAQIRAAQNSWVYTAINLRSAALSSTPYSIFFNPGGIPGEGEVLPGHPASQVLHKPNPYMGGTYLWYYSQWWADLDGNFFWLIVPDSSGKPAEIWPLPSSDITIETGDKGNIIDNYLYEPQHWGGRWDIDPKFMFHFRYPNPFNFFRGMSPLVAGLLAADSDNAMAEWNGSFFGSSNTMPSAVISLSSGDIKKPMDSTDIDAITDQLRDEYSASQRKTVVTNAYDMSVELLGWNAKDMDFLAGRQFTKEEIFITYGIPAGMVDKNATEANAMAGRSVFQETTLYPLTRLYDEELTAQFITQFYGEGLELRHDDVRPIDKEFELKEAKTHSSYVTVDEYRDKYLDLEPLPGGRGTLMLSESKQQSAENSTGKEKEDSNFSKSDNSNDKEKKKPANNDGLDEDAQKALSELILYEKKSLNYFKRGKSATVKFNSEKLSDELINAIGLDLQGVVSSENVKSVFEYYTDWLKGGTGSGNFGHGGLHDVHGGSGESKESGSSGDDEPLFIKWARENIGKTKKPRPPEGSPAFIIWAWENYTKKKKKRGITDEEMLQIIKDNFNPGSDVPLKKFGNKALPLPWRPWSAFDLVLFNCVKEILQDQLSTLVEDIRLRQSANMLLDDALWATLAEQFTDECEPRMLELTQFGTKYAADLIEGSELVINWDLVNTSASEWASEYAASQVTKINETTRKAIRAELAEWTAAGETLPELTQRLQTITDATGTPLFSEERAERIAITENTDIFANANIETWVNLGYARPVFQPKAHVRCRCYPQPLILDNDEKVIVWYTAHDERVCQVDIDTKSKLGVVKGCRELHGMIVSEGPELGKYDFTFGKLDDEQTKSLKGGVGSGFFGHAGRIGLVGGSSSSVGKKPLQVGKFMSYKKGNAADLSRGVKKLKPNLQQYITLYSKEEYDKMGAKIYLSEDKNSGFAIKPNGELISVFSSVRGRGKELVEQSVRLGATKLDCYEEPKSRHLTKLYSTGGFIETERLKWDDQYAPPNWDYKNNDNPDVVIMERK